MSSRLFDAAELDGANNWQIVPALFEFQAAWTDLVRRLIHLRDSSDFTVPRG